VTSIELVESFATSPRRFDVYQSLVALGTDALPALRAGLHHADWRVRQWSAICLDRVADPDTLRDLIPLLRDHKPQVRLWAVHSLACNHCKEEVRCPVDVVPLLIERVQTDDQIRVRRMAVIMLGTEFLDRRAVPVLTACLGDPDRRMRLHAAAGLRRLTAAHDGRAFDA
jgi:HEAT repeat protein